MKFASVDTNVARLVELMADLQVVSGAEPAHPRVMVTFLPLACPAFTSVAILATILVRLASLTIPPVDVGDIWKYARCVSLFHGIFAIGKLAIR